MPHPDAVRWNRRYQKEGSQRIDQTPNHLLRRNAQLLNRGGLALDAACGLAANGRYLARLGWRVVGLDISWVALEMACQAARAQQLTFCATVLDLTDPWLPPGHFDLLMNFRFLERAALPAYRAAIKPGGLLFFETFLRQGPENGPPGHYLLAGELREAFGAFETLSSGTRISGGRTLEWLVARKP